MGFPGADLVTIISDSIREPSVVDGIMDIPLGIVSRFVITNRETEPLYISILEIDQAGDVIPLFPKQLTGSVEEAVIQSNVAIRELVCTEKYVEPVAPRRVQHNKMSEQALVLLYAKDHSRDRKSV